jgi:hypothetical protein
MRCNVKFTIQIATPPVSNFIYLAYPVLLEGPRISFIIWTDLSEFCGKERKADMETLTIVHRKNGERRLGRCLMNCRTDWQSAKDSECDHTCYTCLGSRNILLKPGGTVVVTWKISSRTFASEGSYLGTVGQTPGPLGTA